MGMLAALAVVFALMVNPVTANGAQCLKEHQKTAMQRVKDGADVCEVFQDQLNCFKNKAQCKGMLPVVKQAAESAKGKGCTFTCDKKAAENPDEDPSKVRTAD